MGRAATQAATATKLKQYLNYNEPLYALVHLASLYKSYHRPLMFYLGAGALGYLGASVAKGLQETVVREQETAIRADLVGQLRDVFRRSLQRKYAWDADLQKTARARLDTLLAPYHLSVAALAQPQPVAALSQPPDTDDRQYAYFPSVRQRAGPAVSPTFSGPSSSLLPAESAALPQLVPSAAPRAGGLTSARWLQAAALGLGWSLGVMTHGFFNLLGRAPTRPPTALSNEIGTFVYNAETAFIANNRLMLAGVFALTAGARLGKLLVDALREMEVTRRNAQTEYRYQAYNWGQLDPMFHQIAEQTAMAHDLRQFEADLPSLLGNPARLAQRVETVLQNRGRSSPPPYFPATPAVMLTEAKS
jgi:hypothetical protein